VLKVSTVQKWVPMVPIVVQDEMKLDAPLGAIVMGPGEGFGTKGDDGSIQA